MQRIVIDNFGPIEHFEADLDKNLNIFIGQQATGKSTIAKLVYFFESINNEFVEWCWLNEFMSFAEMIAREDFDYFLATIEGQFADLFKTILSRRNYKINYNSNGNEVKIFNLDGQPSIEFNDKYISFLSRVFKSIETRKKLNSNKKVISSLKEDEFFKEILYIPAGRNIFSLLPLGVLIRQSSSLDELTVRFAQFIDGIKNITNPTSQKTLSQHSYIKCSEELIKNILKGNYRYEGKEDLLYYSDTESIPLTAASSGQQEIVWILLTLLDVILNNKKMFIVIEEPEAHIFPETQKRVMELIALAINATDSQVLITTHSPYILTSTNLLIHSANVENKITDEETVIDKDMRLDRSRVGAYMLTKNGKFVYENIIDGDSGLIISEHIDGVSDEINMNTDKLIDLEVKYKI